MATACLSPTSKAGVIHQIDLDTKAVSAFASGFGGPDGIVKVDDGKFLISDFNGRIFLHEEGVGSTLLLETGGGAKTADIGYDAATQMVYVPTYTDDRVVAYQLDLGEGELLAPIVIDLDGDGLEFVEGVSFDFDADGTFEIGTWVGADDALLALDRNGDGQITDGSEISFVDDLPGAKTDLEGLAAFDDDGDGALTTDDAAFAEMFVWTDANGDGVSQKDELMSLAEAGILSLDLTSDGAAYVDATGAQVLGLTTAEGTEGPLSVGDVMLPYQEDETRAPEAALFDLA